ncbi:hypothetical protein [Magnetospirillum sp. 15-1]|uniref:hypothetical protein n=1 Tax=Magnetospirillum sp. 15-1 TaxID=1979370 RepID=UPI000BBCAABC|nr:hypothetical protein [Magnetospirillum sp. 15-1]
MPYFSKDVIADLHLGRERGHQQYADLMQRYIQRDYTTDLAREHAQHGFARRLGCLVHAIDMVYTALPPEQDDIPGRDKTLDATIAIQSFVSNVFGCLDNLAWIYVSEKNVRNRDGTSLVLSQITLGSEPVRASFTDEFRAYLDRRKRWFTAMKKFRDSLAHRIPLYIPPFTILPENQGRYNALEQEANEAQKRRDFDEYDRLRAEQREIGKFRPWIAHSLYEKEARPIVFHPQLIADYNTVDEFGRKMLDELDR